METFPTHGPVSVVVRVGAGRVRVAASDAAEVGVALSALNSAGEEAVAHARVEHSEDSLVVDVPRRVGGLFRGAPQVVVEVRCPHGSTLQVKAEAADVRAEGTFAVVDLLTGSGDVVVDHVTGTAKCKTGSGAITTGQVEGTLAVSTGSGDVGIDSSGTTTTVTVGSGDISVGRLSGDVVTKTGSGDVEIGILDGSLLTKTGSGDLTVRRAASGSVRATGASGTIDIGVPEGTAAWLDLSTITGRVRQELGESAGPQPHQARVEITAHTVNGDLRVHRA